MEQEIKLQIARSIETFCLPHYREIPDIGLFLDQTAKYVTEAMSPLLDGSLTGSMVSNYVKKGLISSPVRKQYNREQISHLFFIAAAKSVLTLEELQWMIRLQKISCSPEKAYEYFRQELQNVLFYVFGLKEELEIIGLENTDEKTILRNTIIAVAHKAYLNKTLAVLQQEQLRSGS